MISNERSKMTKETVERAHTLEKIWLAKNDG